MSHEAVAPLPLRMLDLSSDDDEEIVYWRHWRTTLSPGRRADVDRQLLECEAEAESNHPSKKPSCGGFCCEWMMKEGGGPCICACPCIPCLFAYWYYEDVDNKNTQTKWARQAIIRRKLESLAPVNPSVSIRGWRKELQCELCRTAGFGRPRYTWLRDLHEQARKLGLPTSHGDAQDNAALAAAPVITVDAAVPVGEARILSDYERLQETLAKEMASSRVLSIELAELVVRAEAASGTRTGEIPQSVVDEYKYVRTNASMPVGRPLAALAALARNRDA